MWIKVTQIVEDGTPIVYNLVNTDNVERVHATKKGITIHFVSGLYFDFAEDMAWWAAATVESKS